MTEKQSIEEIDQEMGDIMIEKIDALRTKRKEINQKRKKEVASLKHSFELKMNRIDKKIYEYENAIKKLIGARRYYQLRSNRKVSKSKDLNTSSTNNNKENNNKLSEENKNGLA